MRTPRSLPFEESVLAICGLQRGDKFDSLLSSLPSELCFNQLRDTSRRHAKQYLQSPSAIHCVSWKAAHQFAFGCENLALTDMDWSQTLKQGQIRASVHQSLRATDKAIGVSAEGLTRHRTNKWYTKSHIFTQRLHLLRVLSHVYNNELGGTVEDKRDQIVKLHESMWLSKLVPELWLCKYKGGIDLPDSALLVVRAGPHTVGCLKLSLQDDVYKIEQNPRTYIIVDTVEKVEVAEAKAKIQEWGLGWEKSGPWMGLADWVADHGIHKVTASLLAGLLSKLNMKPRARLDHKHLVEFYLRQMNRSDDYIAQVLENLVIRAKKKRDKPEIGEDNPETWIAMW